MVFKKPQIQPYGTHPIALLVIFCAVLFFTHFHTLPLLMLLERHPFSLLLRQGHEPFSNDFNFFAILYFSNFASILRISKNSVFENLKNFKNLKNLKNLKKSQKSQKSQKLQKFRKFKNFNDFKSFLNSSFIS